ncbi:hypothetical protein CBW16_03380 [Flavobacteriaceae bacterium JJC]|nr:hypothetical protein CBW16_03380 [Flavobacteriaceae bacterium JJC]
MKFKGAEKQFWWHFKGITNTKQIPDILEGIKWIDTEDDDLHMSFLVDRIPVIHHIFMKETELTDEGVKWIGQIKELKSLTLMKHPKITRKSLPYLNNLTELEYLDLWRTGILLADIRELNRLKNLREITVSPTARDGDGAYPEMDRDSILEKVIELEGLFPGCIINVDSDRY